LKRAIVLSLYLQYIFRLYDYAKGLSNILGLADNLDSRHPRTIFLILLHFLDTVASDTQLKYAIHDIRYYYAVPGNRDCPSDRMIPEVKLFGQGHSLPGLIRLSAHKPHMYNSLDYL
jgi:hypothetical protein